MARALGVIALVVAAVEVGLYVAIACLRARFPYALEWMEGAVLEHVARLRSGEALYVEPSVDFVPLMYPPLFFHLAAGVAGVVGEGFLALRSVSIASSLVVFGLLYSLVRRETGSGAAALLGLGLFAATYRTTGAWLDLGRVDSLFLALWFGAAYLMRCRPDRRGLVFAAVLVALSVQAKQSGILLAAPLALYSAVFHRARCLWFVLPAVLLTGGSILILDHLSGGWYAYYLYELPRGFLRKTAESERMTTYWTVDIGARMGIAVVASVFAAVRACRTGERERGVFVLLLLAGAIGGSWLPRVTAGGYDNVLLPAYLALSVGLGLGAHAALDRARGASIGLVHAICIVQLLVHGYEPREQVPGDAARAAGDAFARRVASVDGDVFLPEAGYVAARAGKRTHAHFIALINLDGDPPMSRPIWRELKRRARARAFAAVAAESPWFEDHYVVAEELRADVDVPRPLTGAARWPALWLVPKE